MLKQIGVCMLLWVLISISRFVFTVVIEVDSVDVISIITITHLNNIIVNWLANVILGIFLYSIFQFICAQAPEHMKGFFLVWLWIAVVAIFLLLNNYFTIAKCFYHKLKYCGVYLTSVAVAFSLLVFAVYCCVARWYKRRERDEPCNERARIEEIYGRHVEHNSIEEQDSD